MYCCTANVPAVAYLSPIEADGHDAQLVGVGEETGSDSGWLRHCAYGMVQYAVCKLFAEQDEISATRSRIATRQKSRQKKRR